MNNKFNPKEHIINLERNPQKPSRHYLEVKWRLVWLNEDHPIPPNSQVSIITEPYILTDKLAIIKATATVENGNFKLIRTAYSRCTLEQFPDFVEKSETAAIGRVLLMLGYGTQWALEYDEGTEAPRPKLADAPIETQLLPSKAPKDMMVDPPDQPNEPESNLSTLAEWRVKCYNKYAKFITSHNSTLPIEVYHQFYHSVNSKPYEDASVDELKTFFNSPDSANALLIVCKKRDAIAMAEDLDYDKDLHEKAFFRRYSIKFEDADLKTLELWLNILELFGKEYLQSVIEEMKETPFANKDIEELEAEPTFKLYADIRKLWAKIPEYSAAKHKIASIKTHIGDYEQLSDCKDEAKLKEYLIYLNSKVEKQT